MQPEPYLIVRKKLAKREGDAYYLAPDNLPPTERTWSGFCFYAPLDVVEAKKRADEVRTSFGIDTYPEPTGGCWLFGGYNDLERVLRLGGRWTRR